MYLLTGSNVRFCIIQALKQHLSLAKVAFLDKTPRLSLKKAHPL
jgi:hypothetical protein